MKSKYATLAATQLIPMKTTMRLMLAVAALVAALCFNVKSSHASGDAPWCAVISFGSGDDYWDCQYRSVEECVPNVLAGNRGFCNHNPWYEPKTIGSQKHRKRHVRQH